MVSTAALELFEVAAGDIPTDPRLSQIEAFLELGKRALKAAEELAKVREGLYDLTGEGHVWREWNHYRTQVIDKAVAPVLEDMERGLHSLIVGGFAIEIPKKGFLSLVAFPRGDSRYKDPHEILEKLTAKSILAWWNKICPDPIGMEISQNLALVGHDLSENRWDDARCVLTYSCGSWEITTKGRIRPYCGGYRRSFERVLRFLFHSFNGGAWGAATWPDFGGNPLKEVLEWSRGEIFRLQKFDGDGLRSIQFKGGGKVEIGLTAEAYQAARKAFAKVARRR